MSVYQGAGWSDPAPALMRDRLLEGLPRRRPGGRAEQRRAPAARRFRARQRPARLPERIPWRPPRGGAPLDARLVHRQPPHRRQPQLRTAPAERGPPPCRPSSRPSAPPPTDRRPRWWNGPCARPPWLARAPCARFAPCGAPTGARHGPAPCRAPQGANAALGAERVHSAPPDSCLVALLREAGNVRVSCVGAPQGANAANFGLPVWQIRRCAGVVGRGSGSGAPPAAIFAPNRRPRACAVDLARIVFAFPDLLACAGALPQILESGR